MNEYITWTRHEIVGLIIINYLFCYGLVEKNLAMETNF